MQAGGVDQHQLRVGPVHDAAHDGAGGLRARGGDRDLRADQRVGQGRLAGVGPPDEGRETAAERQAPADCVTTRGRCSHVGVATARARLAGAVWAVARGAASTPARAPVAPWSPSGLPRCRPGRSPCRVGRPRRCRGPVGADSPPFGRCGSLRCGAWCPCRGLAGTGVGAAACGGVRRLVGRALWRLCSTGPARRGRLGGAGVVARRRRTAGAVATGGPVRGLPVWPAGGRASSRAGAVTGGRSAA